MKKMTITLIILLIIISSFFYFDGRLGKGSYFIYYAHPDAIKSTEIKNLYLADILGVKYNERYVIAYRIPAKFFDCSTTSSVIYIRKVQYIIIDKETEKIYVTYKKEKFQQKKNEFEIDLFFTKDENMRMVNKLKNNSAYAEKTMSLEECTESFNYPLIQY